MDGWELVRYLHLVALIFFVGGQLMLIAAVAPAWRRHGTEEAMKMAARRFGMGSAMALVVLIATGIAMAGHYKLWGDDTLNLKLAVIVLVIVVLGLHIAAPKSRAIPWVLAALSLLVVWLGVALTYG